MPKGVIQDWGLVEFFDPIDTETTQASRNGFIIRGKPIRVHFCIPGVNAINIYMQVSSDFSFWKSRLKIVITSWLSKSYFIRSLELCQQLFIALKWMHKKWIFEKLRDESFQTTHSNIFQQFKMHIEFLWFLFIFHLKNSNTLSSLSFVSVWGFTKTLIFCLGCQCSTGPEEEGPDAGHPLGRRVHAVAKVGVPESGL